MKKCLECGSEFEPVRKNKRYCSKPCIVAAWIREHPDRRKQHQKKYDDANQERRKAWVADNADHRKQYRREHYAKNKAKYVAAAVDWMAANPAKHKAAQKRYSQTPRGLETANESKHRRRARITGAGGSFTRAEFRRLCLCYDNRCLACGKDCSCGGLQPDHVQPVVLGGANDISNIQPLCASCNRKKSGKFRDYRGDIELFRAGVV